MRLALALPAGAFLSNLNLFAEPLAGKVKITGIKAMGLDHIAGNCLIRIDTDSGLTGYGEAGATGPIARARIETMKPLLIGKDPLAIEVHFQQMSSLMYNYVAHIPTVSGIDIALWDLAGKITNLPVSVLLGGRFRDTIPMYSHGIGLDMLSKDSCREWASIHQHLVHRPVEKRETRLCKCPRGGRRRYRYRRPLSRRTGHAKRDRRRQSSRTDEPTLD
jgi:L-alanine-DL-glutamate epimerase-like enolase superfamily enzyme